MRRVPTDFNAGRGNNTAQDSGRDFRVERDSRSAVEATASANPAMTTSSSSTTAGSGAASLSVNDTSDHVVNAVESGAVGFTVSGLGAGASGTVTFTDA